MTATSAETTQSQARVLSNTTFLLAATVIQKFISLGYVVYYFRTLGNTGAGDFEPVRSAIPIALLLVDLSLSTVLTREVGRHPEKVRRLLGTVLSVKLIVWVAMAIAMVVVYQNAPFDSITRSLIPLAAVVVTLDMITTTFTAALRGLQVFLYEAIGIVVTQVATVLFGIVGFQLGWGLPGLMSSLIAGSVANLLFISSMIRRQLGGFPPLNLDRGTVKKFFVVAAPILGAALLAKAFTYTDRYLLLTFAKKSHFAIYAAAHRLPFSLEFIASAFAAGLLPAMSRSYLTDRLQLQQMFLRAIRYLLLISIPLAIGVFVLAEPFVLKLLGKTFADAVVPLRIMIFALPLIFLNFPVGSFLIATNRQIWNTINLAVAVVVNISLNVFLQPQLKVEGAAIAVVATYLVLFTLGFIQVGRVISIPGRDLLRTFGQAVLAAAIMAVPIWLLHRTFSPYFLVLPGGMLYIAALLLLGAIRRDDFRLLLRVFSRRTT